uniref:FCP1 homology domain-containing protein n=1 Tax=Chrysotila carterae TaxID=13221 RepID=A0A7S4C1B2_CHRCT
MRILFLDVDGVVCCNYDALVEQAKLLLVLRIIEQTGAYVVLSSDWRRDGAAKYCIETEMRKLGIECIGSTPEREPDKWHRPLEIMDWMLANGRHVTHWVAIDDRMLEKEEGGAAMIGHCVLTEFHTGLTPELVKVAVKILGGPLPAAELRERNEARKRKTKVATNGRIVASLGKEHLFAPPAFAGRYVRDRIPLTAAEYRAAVASVNSQIRWLCCLCPWFVSLKDARERCKQLNQKYADRDVRFMLSAQDKDREYLLVPTLAGDPIPSLIVKQIEPPDAPLPLLKIVLPQLDADDAPPLTAPAKLTPHKHVNGKAATPPPTSRTKIFRSPSLRRSSSYPHKSSTPASSSHSTPNSGANGAPKSNKILRRSSSIARAVRAIEKRLL